MSLPSSGSHCQSTQVAFFTPPSSSAVRIPPLYHLEERYPFLSPCPARAVIASQPRQPSPSPLPHLPRYEHHLFITQRRDIPFLVPAQPRQSLPVNLGSLLLHPSFIFSSMYTTAISPRGKTSLPQSCPDPSNPPWQPSPSPLPHLQRYVYHRYITQRRNILTLVPAQPQQSTLVAFSFTPPSSSAVRTPPLYHLEERHPYLSPCPAPPQSTLVAFSFIPPSSSVVCTPLLYHLEERHPSLVPAQPQQSTLVSFSFTPSLIFSGMYTTAISPRGETSLPQSMPSPSSPPWQPSPHPLPHLPQYVQQHQSTKRRDIQGASGTDARF